MAIYHLEAKPISRAKGRSATGAAAYRAGEKITDERTGIVHDFTHKGGVMHEELILPGGGTADRAEFWNRIEWHHKRGDAVLAREIEIALPTELTEEQRQRLATGYARELADRYGVAADVALHESRTVTDRMLKKKPDQHHEIDPETGRRHSGNWHAHIMLSACYVQPDGTLGKKAVELDPIHCQRAKIENMADRERPRWNELANAELEKAGCAVRIDHRSYLRQAEAAGIAAEIASLPTLHLGPQASALERRGTATEIGNLNREIKVINLQLERARREAKKEAATPAPQRDRLQSELQALLRFPMPPTAEVAVAEIQRQRRELEARTDARMKQDRELQYREMQARLASGRMQDIEQRRVALLARGHDLKNQIRQQERRGRAIEKWTEKHPLRARLLLGLGVFMPGTAVRLTPPDAAGLRADFRQAGREHQELQAKREAAQEAATEAQAAAERERMRAEQEAATAVAEASQRLDQAEAVAEDLQRVEQQQKVEPAPSVQLDVPRPVPRLRQRGPSPGMS